LKGEAKRAVGEKRVHRTGGEVGEAFCICVQGGEKSANSLLLLFDAVQQ
jgi:hypothetical protein